MNNKLTLWYEIEERKEVESEIKKTIHQRYGLSDDEFESTSEGFKFLFDDETNGEIAITFIEKNNALKVSVEGTWPWEVIEVYNSCLPLSVLEDPA